MPSFQSSAMALITLFELGNNHAVVPMRLVQFIYDLTLENTGAVAPIVEVVEQTSVSAGEKGTSQPKTLSVGNLAVFDNNGHMVGNWVKRKPWVYCGFAIGWRELISVCPVQ